MPIFRYTFKKYIKSPSTWIISAITALVIIVLDGVIVLANFKAHNAADYARLSFIIISGMSAFLATFTSVFAGFKAATMYKDEIEDGTFLMILSKPTTRSRIIFEKWLSLVVILIFYTFFVSVIFCLTLIIFDSSGKLNSLNIGDIKINSLRDKSWIISIYLWLILFVTGLIFSSLAILFGTKMSVGSTIGLTIALGVIIPITQIIGVFGKTSEYQKINNQNSVIIKNYSDYLNSKKVNSTKVTKDIYDSTIPEKYNDLYDLTIPTKNKDNYRNILWADINFQINTLAEFATDQIVPSSNSSILELKGSNSNPYGMTGKTFKVLHKYENADKSNIEEIKQLLNHLIKRSWEQIEPVREKVINIYFRNAMDAFFKSNSNWYAQLSPEMGKLARSINIKSNNDSNFPSKVNKDYFDKLKYWSIDKSGVDKNNLAKVADYQARYYALLNSFASTIRSHKNLFEKSIDYSKEERKFSDKFGIPLYDALSYVSTSLPMINLKSFYKFIHVKKLNNNVEDSALKRNSITKDEDQSPALYNLFYNQMFVYSKLASIYSDGFTFARTKKIPYVTKYGILYIYLAIAAGLIPLAYLVLRRQDIR